MTGYPSPQGQPPDIVAGRVQIYPAGAPGKYDPYADLPEWKPKGTPKGVAPAETADPYSALSEWTPPEKPAAPARDIGTGEAAARGAVNSFTFGFGPALEGVAAASGQPAPTTPGERASGAAAARPIEGALKLFHENVLMPMLGQDAGGMTGQITGDTSGEATKAYHRGREAALADQQLAQEQHPGAYLAGQIAGTIGTPGFGVGQAGGLAARAGRGLVAGVAGGSLYGAGEATSAGEDVGGIAGSAARSGAIGAAIGGPLNAAVGRRIVNAAQPGARAAATAESLGAPLPRGLASDNPTITASAAAAKSIPWFGARMSTALDRTQTAAGNAIEGIAGHMAGPATDRAAAEAVVKPALEGVIDRNRQAVDTAYDAVRNNLQGRHYAMPRTDAALNRVMAARRAAGWTNPAQGLEQFRNVAGGATFEGAHRARVDAREAGNVLVPHPGYNAADFNQITRAMTADVRSIVAADARGSPRRALDTFDRTERAFGQIHEINDALRKLADAGGEGAIKTLIGNAKEAGGNLRQLAQLRRMMNPQDFSVIGGVMLNELGHNAATGEFSLNQFVTRWDKVSDRAKAVLFAPGHLQNIEDIVNLGSKIKGALRTQNTSHTSNTLILFDLARDALMLGVGLGTGAVSGGATLLGGAVATPAVIFAHWLSSPATAASMGAWSRAWRAITAQPGNAARRAAFNTMTRNLANNIGVPVDRIMSAVMTRTGGTNQ